MASGPYRKAVVPIEPPEYVITTGMLCLEHDGLGGRSWPTQTAIIKPTYPGKWKLIDTHIEPGHQYHATQRAFFWTWKKIRER